jgi:RNA polymerase sigma factor (sigma-70 family)
MLARATQGDRAALGNLVSELTPTIRASVSSTLARRSGRRAARQEVEDLTQTVLLALFADEARALAQWDPERGLGLHAFVALLAKRETISVLRSQRRSPWTERPTLLEDLDRNAVPGMGPESETISRDMLQNLASAVKAKLSAKGAELFDLLFMRGLSAEEVSAITGLSADAVYAWNSRLSRQVRDILIELRRTVPPPPKGSSPGARQPPRSR